MSLYKATVGSGPQASDVNQLIDAFLGAHDLGNVTFAPSLSAPSTTGITATAVSGSTLGIGVYNYQVTLLTGYYKSDGTLQKTGETTVSAVVTATTTSGNQSVSIAFPTSGLPTSAIAWGIYRTAVGGSTYGFVASVKIGTASYVDSMADGSRNYSPPSSNTTGTAFNFGSTVSAPYNVYSIAIGSAGQAIPASTDTLLTFTSTSANLAGDSAWASNVWTCPVAGIYLIAVNAVITPAASSLFQVKLFYNGALDQYLVSDYIGSAQMIARAGVSLKKLIVGDTLKFYANAGATAGTFNGNYSRAVIAKIG